MSITSSIYHHLPDKVKRRIRLHTKSYNDVRGSKNFKERIERTIGEFMTPEELSDKESVRKIIKDIKRCWLKFGSSPEEYFLLGFKDIDDEQKAKFITDYDKDMTMKKVMGLEIFARELQDKYNFHNLTAPFFHREVFKVDSLSSKEEFISFAIKAGKIFVKPDKKSRGRGAHVCVVTEEKDAVNEFDSLIAEGGEWIAEELIVQSKETAEWNASSVNSVRVPTFLNADGFFVGVPFFRTGRAGACIDNAGGGGIFANIDPASGIITTPGIDELGHFYEKHPDSGLTYKGYQMPRWNELMETVERVHRECMPHHIYIGWDFALTDDGWVLIEGNWGQFVSQYADHIGFRENFFKYMNAGFYKKS